MHHMEKPPPSKLKDLRKRLRAIRKDIAGLNSKSLTDADSLLSVAESEVDRAISTIEQEEGEEPKSEPEARGGPPPAR